MSLTAEGYSDAPGEVISPGALTIPKARELAEVLGNGTLPYMRLVEARRHGDDEFVVLDVEPEVPQHPVHDIRRVERIAIRFDPEDRFAPDPLALRVGFPQVPHTNFRVEEHPRSLCLFEARYEDQKPRWTAAAFAKQLHRWLSLTARGELHAPDQPLEPFFVGSLIPIVLPDRFYKPGSIEAPVQLVVTAAAHGAKEMTLIAHAAESAAGEEDLSFTGVVMEGEPRTHGVIRLQPTNLGQLHAYLTEVGCDLVGTLRRNLTEWSHSARDALARRVILIVRLPKRRTDEEQPESAEVWAFATLSNFREVGQALGLWEIHDGHLVPIIGGGEARPEEVRLDLLNPMPAFTRDRAARANGLAGAVDRRVVSVGAGALGSQVAINLMRAGYGVWTLVDEDRLLPHNLARHALGGDAVGYSKAFALSVVANGLFETGKAAEPIIADVLATAGDDLRTAFSTADVILDLAASVTVARHLTDGVQSPARRVSLFLNPDGTDLVLLAEDAERRILLDDLEMQYYRELIHHPDLSRHLLRSGERIRYAQGCRDVTTAIPQDQVAVHAGIGARALRRALDVPTAMLAIWRTDEDLAVSLIKAEPVPYERLLFGSWTLAIDPRLIDTVHNRRADKLPNETGGVLLGSFDLQRKIAYVVDTIASPPDSEEWPTLYIRGHEGLRDAIDKVDRVTGGALHYVGEWHSHPDGAACTPSDDDQKVFAWLASYMAQDGLPPLMAIIGGRGETNWLFGGQ